MNLISDNYSAFIGGVEFARHNEPQAETDKAIGLSRKGGAEDLVWIPKSVCCAAIDGGVLRLWIKPWFLSELS